MALLLILPTRQACRPNYIVSYLAGSAGGYAVLVILRSTWFAKSIHS